MRNIDDKKNFVSNESLIIAYLQNFNKIRHSLEHRYGGSVPYEIFFFHINFFII